MTKPYQIISCAVCNITIGYNFSTDNNPVTYCATCGHAMMRFTNQYTPNSYKLPFKDFNNYSYKDFKYTAVNNHNAVNNMAFFLSKHLEYVELLKDLENN